MIRNILSLILIATVMVLFIGCGGKSSKPKRTENKIAIVLSTLSNPWFVVLADSAKGRAIEHGYKAQIFNSQNDFGRESDHFDNIIAEGYKAILLNPIDADKSLRNVIRAKNAGIPTFCMDRELAASDAAVSQILTDSYTGCVQLGEYFVKKLNQKGNYVELLGVLGSNNTWSRSKGFHSVVDNYPNLKMLAQKNADYDREKAKSVFASMIKTYPNINAVFCGNDAMAMGAYDALVDAGKDKKVLIFGFDGSEDVINAITQKKVAATVMQFPKLIAKKAADMAHEYIQGKKDFQPRILTDVKLITEDNVSMWKLYWLK